MQDEIAQLTAALARVQAGSSDFDLNPHLQPPRSLPLRPAAVLLAIAPASDGARLVLTKRASHLAHHPGQIAFPGGKQEAQDAGPTAAALREAHEEIGLAPQSVQVLGCLPDHETVTGFCMTPVIGIISAPQLFSPDAAEVDEVFTLPLRFATDLRNFRIEGRIWQGHMRHYYTVPYGPYYIWGATARVLYGLAQRLASCT
jgi:8-oxo-dGTP pyrophosphatase MutT (NUDIX family)